MADSAAFFDLDRTLLLGASGPDISAALRRHGVLPDRPIPGERALFGLFDVIGETLPSIALTRQGVRAAAGWSVEAVAAAAEDVADVLADKVEPFAREALAEHRHAGRKLVLATTTPYDLVAPFAERLGFDDVLATRYRSVDGRYDGTIDGEFVWSRGKARSVVAWANANLIELADSYAYSDSFFDVPMLSRVGYPVAVNPDPRLLLYATAREWPRVWFNAPPGVPKPIGIEPQDVAALAARPELFPWVRIEVDGLDRLPAEGPVLLAANHRSYLDPMIVAYATAQAGRRVRFLAKKEVTDAAVIGPLVSAFGAIRVDRGSGSGAPMVEAARALRGGELVTVFPQGTIPRGHDFFDPTLRGRHGAVRLATETGVALTPVGIWGTERAWPRSSRLPYVLNLADPPTVTIRFGAPYRPPVDDIDAATSELMARIVDLLPAEARMPYTPTDAELARTFPPS
ncbi:MAG: HAD-IB family hydrolase [Actinomycetota bacterium]